MDMRAKTCCFTGHRSLSGAEKLKVAVRLRKAIKSIHVPIPGRPLENDVGNQGAV